MSDAGALVVAGHFLVIVVYLAYLAGTWKFWRSL